MRWQISLQTLPDSKINASSASPWAIMHSTTRCGLKSQNVTTILKQEGSLPGTQQATYAPACEPMLLQDMRRASLCPGSITRSGME